MEQRLISQMDIRKGELWRIITYMTIAVAIVVQKQNIKMVVSGKVVIIYAKMVE